MSFFRRALHKPQGLWLRKAMFQIHLWTGIGIGLYIFVICVTGSIVVFRRELMRAYVNRPQVSAHTTETKPLNEPALRAAALRAYPDFEVEKVWPGRRGNTPVDIWMTRARNKSERKEHLFDPYNGADLGETRPRGVRVTDWLVSLHDDLLGGTTGRLVNGVGAILLTLLCLTGLIIWWQGTSKWTRGLSVRWTSWQRINWDLHSAIGFWSFIAVMLWAISGIYLVFPHPFSALVDFIQPLDPVSLVPRRGDLALEWLAKLHFGRFAGIKTKWTWAILGLIPPVLFITGAVMWWNRVLRPFAKDSFNEQSANRVRRRRSHGRPHGVASAGRG